MCVCVCVCADSLLSAVSSFTNSDEMADVEFRVGVEGEAVMAHRFILAARSAVFKAQLGGHMREATHPYEPIPLPDVSPAAFQVRVCNAATS